jgi:hypothetical protein
MCSFLVIRKIFSTGSGPVRVFEESCKLENIWKQRFTHVLDLYPAINMYPLIDLYPVIGKNTLASHPSDGFLHFLCYESYREIHLGVFVIIGRILNFHFHPIFRFAVLELLAV